ncbi:hypothetical protein IWX90DRAFT_484414 [Phyllosticta citrichinensis]|uniref:Uncharacterized protein n=1 Tax=Phyllosticta citrichinensis TaxID=1130410 RepID=A0ABR1XZC1_9PEZI
MDRDFPLYAIELSRLRDFSDQRRPQRKIHFRLESDSIPIRSSPVDLWIPMFHRYGSSPEGNVRHLDETSTWRGLSMTQAREIKFWEDMFAAVLEYKISNHLIDIIDAMDECGAARRPESLNHRICESINSMGCRNYPVNIQEFLTCMIELYKRHGSQYNWLASSGDFYNGLCEFLRTRDCFLDTPLLPTVKVAFWAAINAQGEPTVCGRVKRYGPIVRFKRLDSEASFGRKCHIQPVYVDSVLDPEYDSYVGRPEYQLKSDCVAFEWDGSQRSFGGYLKSGHIEPSMKPTPTSLDLTVTGTRFFPDQVRFERTIRLNIDIMESSSSLTVKEQSSSMCKDMTNGKESMSSRREDSLVTENSRVTAINSTWVNPVIPEDFQTEIKEWYDILFLKQQVERDLGRSRAGNKSDEEAFEEAFRGEDDADIESVDHDAE